MFESENESGARISFVMDTPNLILMLRSRLNARQVTGLAVYLVGFSGIIAVLCLNGLYQVVPQLLARHIPLELMVLVTLWIGMLAGISAQMRLLDDRPWIRFINLMPVSPWQTLTLHLNACFLVLVLVALSIPCLTAGGGISWWSPVYLLRWLVWAVAWVWCFSLELVWVMLVSRHRKGLLTMRVALMVWIMILVMRMDFSSTGGGGLQKVTDFFLQDCGLRLLGVTGLIRTLTSSGDSFVRTALFTLGHLMVNTVLLMGCAWYYLKRRPIERQESCFEVALSRPVKAILRKLIPGALGGQVCIESLRILRSTSKALISTLVLIMAIVLLDRISGSGGENGAMALLVGSMVLAMSTGKEILAQQQGNALYDVYGVDSRHYLWAFTGSLGIVVAMFCLFQIPLLGASDGYVGRAVFSACAASTILLADFGLVYSRRFRLKGEFRFSIMIPGLLETGICMTLIFVTAMVNWCLSLIHFFIPLLLAGIVLYFRARNSERRVVKKLYWEK